MEEVQSMKLKIKTNGLDKFRDKLKELGREFKKMENSMNKIYKIVEEMNQLEIFVDTGIDREKSSQ